MSTLLEIFRERSPQAVVDESYKSLRKVLEPVWSTEQQNESGGWRRERPGKYSIGSVNEKNNETQFMRYSLLRRYLLSGSALRSRMRNSKSRHPSSASKGPSTTSAVKHLTLTHSKTDLLMIPTTRSTV